MAPRKTSARRRAEGLSGRSLDEVVVHDEAALSRTPYYDALKAALRRARFRFQVLPHRERDRWDRALLLNLTYWHAAEGGDVLARPRVPADVVAHAAWHHLAAQALFPRGAPSAAALFLGESIASAFDLFLVGHLLSRAPRAAFLSTQVPAMRDSAIAAGVSRRSFAALLARTAADPERAFGELRSLLYDAATGLFAARSAAEGHACMARVDGRSFAPLLPHYELSNWVLYARAYGSSAKPSASVRTIDAALRERAQPLAWLASRWLA